MIFCNHFAWQKEFMRENLQGRYFWASCLLAGVLAVLPSLGRAETATGTWPLGQAPTQTPNIPPANTQTSIFAGTSGNFNYVAYPFTVSVSGNYNATASTPVVVNTTWFLRGNFVPGIPMGTPLVDFFSGVFAAAGPAPFTGTFTNVPLVAGQQYTMLVAYNIGSVSGETSTVTINGPGCVAIGTNVCAVATTASIPTLSEWGMLLMTALMAVAGVFMIRRKSFK